MSGIVVGVDGSERGPWVAAWAAAEGRVRGLGVRVVYAVPAWVDEAARAGDPLRDRVEDVVAQAVQVARRAEPGVEVDGGTVAGGAAEVLVEASREAAMLVLAGRGRNAVAGLLLGSVTLQAASHAHCPVVVVKDAEPVPPGAHGEVVVGVDGEADAQAAVAFAADEASRRGSRLRAVHAWTTPRPDAPGDMLPLIYDVDTTGESERRLLSEALAGLREHHPDVRVEEEVVQERPAKVLAAASEKADLLVVGSRGRGGFAGLLLGSVSHRLLAASACAVAVVPPVTR